MLTFGLGLSGITHGVIDCAIILQGAAGLSQIVIRAGETPVLRFIFTDDSGPVDVSGGSFRLVVAASDRASEVLLDVSNQFDTSQAAQGVIIRRLSASETISMGAGERHLQIHGVLPSGHVVTNREDVVMVIRPSLIP